MDKVEEFKRALKWHLQEGYVKVRLDSGETNEWLWCVPVEEEPDLLKVANIPFFYDEPCLHDLIRVEPIPDSDFYRFLSVETHVHEGVYVRYQASEDREGLQELFSAFGEECRKHDLKIEGMAPGFVVVAVPYGTREASTALVRECAANVGMVIEEIYE